MAPLIAWRSPRFCSWWCLRRQNVHATPSGGRPEVVITLQPGARSLCCWGALMVSRVLTAASISAASNTGCSVSPFVYGAVLLAVGAIVLIMAMNLRGFGNPLCSDPDYRRIGTMLVKPSFDCAGQQFGRGFESNARPDRRFARCSGGASLPVCGANGVEVISNGWRFKAQVA